MYIVTGGAGFIGSNLVKALNDKTSEPVVVVDDLTDGHKFCNIADLAVADYFDKDEFVELLESNPDYLKDVKAIFHQGACSATTEWDGRFMMENNYAYSRELLHLCLEYGVPFIYASSAAVYGASTSFIETPANELPLNVYGYSKLLFDQYVRRLALDNSRQVVGLRYFNVYGPREQHKGSMASVAFHFDQQLRKDGEVRLFEGSAGYGNGEQERDFVYVEDVCNVNLWFLEHPQQSGIYNAGTGRAQPFNDVAKAVINWHDKGSIRYVPFPDGLKAAYQSYTQADLGALRETGCDVEFRTVQAGVKAYMKALSAS